MKKLLVLGFGVVAFFAVSSIANAQFVVGDRVQTTAAVNVRSTPGGTYLGSHMTGDYGTVIGGPVVAPMGTSTPYTWWNVDYDFSVDGWSVGDYLIGVTKPPVLVVCGDLNGDGVINAVDVTLVINYAFRGVAIPAGVNADVNGDGTVNILDVNLIIDTAFRGAEAPTGCAQSQPNQPPVITSLIGPMNPAVGTLTNWTAQAFDPENGVLNYYFNWGDGSPVNLYELSPSGVTVSLNHVFANPGVYTVVLTVRDFGTGNASATSSVTINVVGSNQPPTNLSLFAPTIVTATTTYWAQASDPEGGGLIYSINFGDGIYLNPNPTSTFPSGYTFYFNHTYLNSGTSTITFTATDQGGLSSSVSKVVLHQSNLQVPAVNAQTEVSVPSVSPNQVVAGSVNNTLASFRLYETTNIEDVRILGLNVFHNVGLAGDRQSLTNYRLYNGATLIGVASFEDQSVSISSPGPGYFIHFDFSNPVVITKSGSVILTLKGDVAAYGTGAVTDNSFHRFRIVTSQDPANDWPTETVVARGVNSNLLANVALGGGLSGQTQVLRSKLTVSAVSIGPTTNRVKQVVDNLANITLSADSAGAVSVNNLWVTFTGTAKDNTTFWDGVKLVDSATGALYGIYPGSASSCVGTSSCHADFFFGNGANGLVISAGVSRSLTLRIDSTKTAPASSSAVQTLVGSIVGAGDLVFTDGLDSNAVSSLVPSSHYFPLNLASVSYVAGTYTAPTPTPTPTYYYQQTTTPPPAVTVPTTVTYKCGDLNKSGAVDVADKILIQSYWTGGVPVPAGVNADLNGDGVAADILDYSVLNNYLTKGMAAPTCGASTGGTRTLSPSATVLSAMQAQLDAIKNQLVNILLQL
ncbi:MAG: PKD domain-containing protein [Patescibacteria group bacterium]